MSGRLAKVPLFGNIAKAVTVNRDATVGAQIGVNLLLPDGSLAKMSDFGATPGDGGSIDTTDALDEGAYHFYFTNLRAQDAVGSILANSANVTLTYASGASITADLTDLADSGTGVLLATTFDAKGRKTGSRAATITGTAGRVTVANGDAAAGLPTIDLATVADAGGGVLQRTAFDTYGRKTGTSAASTDDLTEGSRLYFTAARVLATVLTGLSLATSAVIAATDTVLQAFGKLQAQITDNLLPAGYIDGLKMVWVSGTALTVTTGAAYIPSLGKVLRVSSDIAKTGLSLSASTWYHVYLYDNAGTPDVEIVTTAPAAAYSGTARTKTGDTSRRYVGSVKTDASGNIYNFFQSGNAINYLASNANAPFLVISGGTATTPTSVSCASVAPLTARMIISTSRNTNTADSVVLATSDCGFTLSGTAFLNNIPPSSGTCGFISTDASQSFLYLYNNPPTGSFVSRVSGYLYER